MDPEEFAAAVEKLITDAREAGLADDEMISELEGIIAGMKGE